MKKCQQKFLSIAWDTEIWVAEEPTHMIHKNGNKFLDAHSNTISKNNVEERIYADFSSKR